MILPLMFLTGMCLVDTLNGLFMAWLYGQSSNTMQRLYLAEKKMQEEISSKHNGSREGRIIMKVDVSENSGTPKSSILIGFSIINHPFWDTHIFLKHPYSSFYGF